MTVFFVHISQTCLKLLDKIRGGVYNKCIKNIAQIFKKYILEFKNRLKYILYILYVFKI